jgi:hypothetical protein
MKEHAMWSELKRLLNVFKLQLVQEIERDSLPLQKRQRSMVFKIEQLLSNG